MHHPLFFILIIFVISSSTIENIAVLCGSSATPTALDGLSNLVGMRPAPQPKQSSVVFDRKSAIATTITVAITLLNIVIYYLRCLSEAEEHSTIRNTSRSRRQFSLEDIRLSTHNFSPEFLIGSGGYGKVYKGSIDGRAVAIKRLKEECRQGEKEFLTEIKMLSKIRNQHLVSLIGFCNEGKERVLVYEYMPRGTLADHLGNLNPPLSWEKRLKISIGAARGLHYLHTSQPKVIHRDVKSSNILLDESWVAKISDFGFSKMGPGNELFTHAKSYAHAFGLLLFEVLCANNETIIKIDKNVETRAYWFKSQGRDSHSIYIDPYLDGKISTGCLKMYVDTMLHCLRHEFRERPSISKILTSLEGALKLQEVSDGKARALGRSLCNKKQ